MLKSEVKVKQLLSLVGLLCAGGILTGLVLSYFSGFPVGVASVSSKKVDDQPGGVMNTFRAVFVTTPNIEVAKKIAHGLVTNRLAACVNIIPQITSVYEWEGKIEEDSELLLMIKTQSDKVEQIDKFVKDNHPYSVPEVIAVPIEQGSEKYLQWIKDTINGGGASGSGTGTSS